MALHRITTPQNTSKRYKNKRAEVTINMEWNPRMGAKYSHKFNKAQAFVDSEVLRLCDPYIPFDSGVLKGSGVISTVIGNGEVIWNTPYAKYQYYGKLMLTEDGRAYAKFGETKTVTETDLEYRNGKSSHWFDRAMDNGGLERVLNGAAAYIRRDLQ